MMLPDAPAAGETPTADGLNIPVQSNEVTPIVVAKDDDGPAEPVAEVAEPVSTDEPASEQGDARKPQKLPEWAQKKMNETAFEAREAKRRAEEAEAKLAAMEAKNKPAASPTSAAPTATDEDAARAAAPAGGYKSEADFNAAVQAEANRRAEQAEADRAARAFADKCNDVYNAGKSAHGDDFDAAVQNLQSVGVMNPEMLTDILEFDNSADILLTLGSDPDKAASLLRMTPTKRVIELTRMAGTATPKKEIPAVSKAPPPITPVTGSARASNDLRDEDDDATWFAKREAQLRAAS